MPNKNTYVLRESDTEISYEEKHKSLLSLLANTLQKSTFTYLEIFSQTEYTTSQTYYEIYRKDNPNAVFNVVFRE